MEREEMQKIIDESLSDYIGLIYNNMNNDHEAKHKADLLKNFTTYLERNLFKQN